MIALLIIAIVFCSLMGLLNFGLVIDRDDGPAPFNTIAYMFAILVMSLCLHYLP